MPLRVTKQLEAALLSEWSATLDPSWQWKTQIRVGTVPLVYNGVVLSPAQRRNFANWSDWCDERIFTGSEIWIVEAKVVGTAGAYGQVLDYARQWPSSMDAEDYPGRPVLPVVLTAFEKPDTASYFGKFGVKTIIFTPSWAGNSLVNKIQASKDATEV